MPSEVQDRRATIEAAFDAVEEGQTQEINTPAPSPSEPVAAAPVQAPADKLETIPEYKPNDEGETKPAVTTPAPKPDDDTKIAAEKAPQSWRPAQKAKWDALDPEVKQEVLRREREITRTLGDTAQARQLATAFTQTVQPYMARINSMNAHPMVAVQELLKADHILSTAPKAQRAEFMAKLINDYDVDFVELDRALSGKAPADPVQSQVDRLLQERLKPFQQFLTTQQQQEEQRRQHQSQTTAQQLESMAADPKYPHFNDVREDMADVIELQAKKGVYLTLEQAYNRAIAMNPEVSQKVNQLADTDAKRQAAQLADARAQRALKASKSVGGAPNGVPNGQSSPDDRRATIAAAFDALGGR